MHKKKLGNAELFMFDIQIINRYYWLIAVGAFPALQVFQHGYLQVQQSFAAEACHGLDKG